MNNISTKIRVNKIKLNKISQELEDVKNRIEMYHIEHSKVEQEILSTLKTIVEEVKQIKEEVSQ